jgi:hypothetical protein
MYLLIALGLAAAYAVISPLGDGLLDTSMWVAKILAPPEAEDNPSTHQLLKFSQAALMEGWLSNIPFIATLLLLGSIVFGFIHAWWGGFVAFAALIFLKVLATMLWRRPVSYYLPLLLHKLQNRAADYQRSGDTARFEAATSLVNDLEHVILLYQGSLQRPPSAKQLKTIPYGDFWLETSDDRKG